jgi:phosphatidate phosphatase APP1
MIGAL